MFFMVALFIWFALSIPAALLIGRMLRAASANSRVPVLPRPVANTRAASSVAS